MDNHLFNVVNGIDIIKELKDKESKNIKIDAKNYNSEKIIFENETIDLSELNVSILNFKEIRFSKCKIKGTLGIIIYNFMELLIEDCIFEDFSNRTLFIESSQDNNSKCEIKDCIFERCGNLYCDNQYNSLVIDIFDISEICIENCKFINLKRKEENMEVCVVLLREIKTKLRLSNNQLSGKIENIILYNCSRVVPKIISIT